MRQPFFIDLDQARELLAGIGIDLTARQMKRAAELDANGYRKLPFFVDPIDGRLKIDRDLLKRIYLEKQVEAQNNLRLNFNKNSNKPH